MLKGGFQWSYPYGSYALRSDSLLQNRSDPYARTKMGSHYQHFIPLGHHGDPEDAANMVAFLASDRAKFITGQAINVDGGMVKSTI